jgi:hypothetical protein
MQDFRPSAQFARKKVAPLITMMRLSESGRFIQMRLDRLLDRPQNTISILFMFFICFSRLYAEYAAFFSTFLERIMSRSDD